MVERGSLEHAHWTIPHDCSGLLDDRSETLFRFRVDVVHRPLWRDLVSPDCSRLQIRSELLSDNGAAWQYELLPGLAHQITCQVYPIGFHQRLANFESHGSEKGASHRAPEEDLVDFWQECFDQVDLTTDLCAA